MGNKGDKLTNISSQTADYLVEKLCSIGSVSSKKMFGGNGIFFNDKMFAMVDSKGQAYLKVNDELKSYFISEGSQPHSKMPYCSIPDEILNDDSTLSEWAEKSIQLIR